MTQSLDVYAFTNPALCALVLWSFVAGFAEAAPRGCELPLAFLPVPIVLSNDTARSFEGTNKRTGLLSWVQKSPELVVGLADKINDTIEYSKQGLLFGYRYRLLVPREDGSIGSIRRGLVANPSGSKKVHASIKTILGHSNRFGYWAGELGHASDVLQALGVTI